MLREEVDATDPGVDGGVPFLQFEPAGGDFFREQTAGGVRRRVIPFLRLEHEVAETPFDARDDATLRGVVTDLMDRREFSPGRVPAARLLRRRSRARGRS